MYSELSYFHIAELRQLASTESPLFKGVLRDDHRMRQTLCENPQLVDAIIQAADEMGFRRLAFLTAGGDSIVFRGVEDKKGREQLLIISPENTEYIRHPMVLPPFALQRVEGGGKGVLLRIMPKIELQNVKDLQVTALNYGLRQSGLNAEELGYGNVGVYHYHDAESGKAKAVPFVLDWGCVNWLNRRPNDVKKAEADWYAEPVFAPWVAAQGDMAKAPQNVAVGAHVRKLEQSMGSGVVTGALRAGIYPEELRALSHASAMQALQGNDDYHVLLKAAVEGYDMSKPPHKGSRQH